ncbi:unnamed protein product [Mytilus edulis]|uniref:STAT transcription factor protein interaction domain-containing protein n=1 Tax=Mytilus edulis TaxID=6550 RepID=A0A8S3RLI5_MYTED|nr:unnamed protein product [Mytilus edulis]
MWTTWVTHVPWLPTNVALPYNVENKMDDKHIPGYPPMLLYLETWKNKMDDKHTLEMSQQWAQLSEISTDYRSKVRSMYADIFPILIRDNFSVWIEEQPWLNITPQSHEEIIEGSILQISEEFQNVNARDASIVQTLQISFVELMQIQQTFLEMDLPNWKYRQQIACNGIPLDSSILQSLQKK